MGTFRVSTEGSLLLDDSSLDLLGYRRDGVGPDAMSWFLSLLTPIDVELLAEDYRRLRSREIQVSRREFCLQSSGGGDVWVRCVTGLQGDELFGTLQSTTEIRVLAQELERQRAKFQAIIDNMPLGLVSFRIDPVDETELLLERVNPTAKSMAKLDWRIGCRARELLKGAAEEDFAKRLMVAKGGAPFTETQRHYMDGTIRGAFDTVFFNSGPGEVTGILHDVTEHIRVEDELRRSNTDLEQFAYGIAHDLQEPVRMVRAFAGLLEKELGELPPKAVPYMRFIQEGAERMKSLIEDLLAYARVGTSQCGELVDANAVLTGVLSDQAVVITETGAQISAAELPFVRCFDVELRQVLSNLLGNALKFRGAEPPVITIGTLARADGRCEIVVQDNGIGFGEGGTEQAFRLFGRLHGREQYEGNGIGLAVCKRIVEQNGGSIWIEPGSKKGACIHFTLPGE